MLDLHITIQYIFYKRNHSNQFQIRFRNFLSSITTRFIWRSYIIIFFQVSLTFGAARGQTWIAWRTSVPCLDVLVEDELIDFENEIGGKIKLFWINILEKYKLKLLLLSFNWLYCFLNLYCKFCWLIIS